MQTSLAIDCINNKAVFFSPPLLPIRIPIANESLALHGKQRQGSSKCLASHCPLTFFPQDFLVASGQASTGVLLTAS